jgi:hypothetical protein
VFLQIPAACPVVHGSMYQKKYHPERLYLFLPAQPCTEERIVQILELCKQRDLLGGEFHGKIEHEIESQLFSKAV